MQNNPYSAVVADYVSAISGSVMNSIRNPRDMVIVGLAALVLAGCDAQPNKPCSNFASTSHERDLNDSREERGLSIICADVEPFKLLRRSK